MIHQQRNEAARSPTITILTTGCADQNMDSSVDSGVSFISGGASFGSMGF